MQKINHPLAPMVQKMDAERKILDVTQLALEMSGTDPRIGNFRAYKTVAKSVLDSMVKDGIMTVDGTGGYAMVAK